MKINHTINVCGELLDFSTPAVMGIINVTPDSFFAGSRKVALKEVLHTAEKMLEEGATFLDVGGYSSRPGATDISVSEEFRRVIEPIEAITKAFPESIISIDTFRSEVAKAAVASGAALVNDISAGHLDEKMLETVASLKVPYIAMHMCGTPQTMKTLTDYDDVVLEVAKYFSELLGRSNQLGIKDVIIDPGFGFAKTREQGFELINRLEHFHHLNRPILVGISRKSMIYQTLKTTAEHALNGTTVINTIALIKGAHVLRVHDVKEAVEAVELVKQLH